MNLPSQVLSQQERIDWLRLIRTENVGPTTFAALLNRFGTAAEALAAIPHLARRGGRSGQVRLCSEAAAAKELRGLEDLGGALIAKVEPDYPAALAAIPDPPPMIAVHGHRHLLGQDTVALVGARNASSLGRKLAETMARELSEAGYVVSSGLARGIDAAAHRGALPHGTIACMAGGIDQVYPEENRALHEQIVERGLAISEMPLGLAPMARHFPRRNRLIAGVSLGTIVIEAARRSGSLITARLAAEMGREVMAVPGSPLDPRATGGNSLIKDGAHLVEGARDILDILSSRRHDPLAEPDRQTIEGVSEGADGGDPQPPPGTHEVILNLLSPAPTPVDELIRDSQLSAAIVMMVILDLELAGRIERHPGNRVSYA